MSNTRTGGRGSVATWQSEIKEYVLEKFGEWYKWEEAPKALMYIVSECGEAHEAWRDNNPDKFMIELADITIRTLDTAFWHGEHMGLEDLDALARAMRDKMDYNWTRPPKHGRVNI